MFAFNLSNILSGKYLMMNEQRRKLILDTLDLLGVNWRDYKLPNHDDVDCIHIVPVSGGSDSKCMAMILPAIFPKKRFFFVCTDTGAEEESAYAEFEEISEWVGTKVHVVKPSEGLFDLIERFNGFLPSGQARYCTRILKLESMDFWLDAKFKRIANKVNLYIGIRDDEDRFTDLSNDEERANWVLPRYPFINLGMARTQVYGLLAATCGISPVYKHASRSSCGCCFFKRNSERVMQCVEAYSEFSKTAAYDKLCPADTDKLNNSIMFNAIMKKMPNYLIGNHHLHNPNMLIAKPVSTLTESEANPIKPIKQSKNITNLDLFDASVNYNNDDVDTIYFAVMFLVTPESTYDAFRGNGDMFNGVYYSKIVNFSHSFNGIRSSLAYVYEQIISTAELYDETQESMLTNMRIGIYEIKVQKGNLTLDKIQSESYTWGTNGLSYRSIEQNVTMMHFILVREGEKEHLDNLRVALTKRFKQAKEYVDFEDRLLEKQIIVHSDLYQRYKAAKTNFARKYDKDELNLGEVTWSGMFENIALDRLPSEIRKQRLKDKAKGNIEGEIACLACSL